MLRVQVAEILQRDREALLHDVRTEAQPRLWQLDSRLWTRKGAIPGCLNATLDQIIAVLLGSSESAENENFGERAGAAMSGFETMDQCIRCWTEAPIAWQDMAVLLEILNERLHHAFQSDDEHCPSLMIVGAISHLKAGITADRLLKLDREMVQQREQNMAAQHLASRFLANASHDLRTPLTAILGFSELLLEETYGALSEGQQTAIGHIENSAQNLLEIINNVLDLMHIRSGKFQLQYRRLAIAPLLRNVYEILVPLSQRKRVTFRDELPSDLGVMEADEGIVRHIVYYLLESSIRSTPQSGEVVLRAERSNARLTIITFDTALHFPPEAIEKMRDAYPILENSPVRGYEGWEIGLPLVQRYAELHSGSLEIESSPDQGTTIRVHLPTQKPAGAESPRS